MSDAIKLGYTYQCNELGFTWKAVDVEPSGDYKGKLRDLYGVFYDWIMSPDGRSVSGNGNFLLSLRRPFKVAKPWSPADLKPDDKAKMRDESEPFTVLFINDYGIYGYNGDDKTCPTHRYPNGRYLDDDDIDSYDLVGPYIEPNTPLAKTWQPFDWPAPDSTIKMMRDLPFATPLRYIDGSIYYVTGHLPNFGVHMSNGHHYSEISLFRNWTRFNPANPKLPGKPVGELR